MRKNLLFFIDLEAGISKKTITKKINETSFGKNVEVVVNESSILFNANFSVSKIKDLLKKIYSFFASVKEFNNMKMELHFAKGFLSILKCLSLDFVLAQNDTLIVKICEELKSKFNKLIDLLFNVISLGEYGCKESIFNSEQFIYVLNKN